MRVGIIVGSIRSNRVCLDLANLIKSKIHDSVIIDLKEWDLPMFAESYMPRDGVYNSERIIRWSNEIKSHDMFIFLTPQYNWGYSAVIKNSIDHLYHEWVSKPAIIVCYGSKGGSKAGHQLEQVLNGVRMNVLGVHPIKIDEIANWESWGDAIINNTNQLNLCLGHGLSGAFAVKEVSFVKSVERPNAFIEFKVMYTILTNSDLNLKMNVGL
ncbi:flavo protein [Conidiobolus coronatus NRRL 28638]|uniref:Flavo protein n=1 Tax=Conidiobolus coronatus (strain ATCC 28846 / CBS 209.66 / NRRL 28638) TaxID=796925 RepID=A0A137P3U3_CONC2|nr:flavo protein [Conidiobolus coronatus NRRL 28638]|eukprot:KXN69564.1 flavo protein [Conidiobolus coronatus NRRL 28638]